jgi:predicted nucleic acid-binding protein
MDMVTQFKDGLDKALTEQAIIEGLEKMVREGKAKIAKDYSYSDTDALIAVTMWENGFRTAEVSILRLFGRL